MDRAKKKGIIVKGVCVLLSFILWLYVSNVENPTRTSDIKNVYVEILNEDILSSLNLYLSPNQDFSVDLKLEGGAKEIYSVSKNDFILKADLSTYALKKGENNIPVEVVSAPDGVTIKNKTMLTVKVNLEESIEKDVKVYSRVKTSFRDGVIEKSTLVSPSSVKVSGPESLVNTVTSVVLKGELSGISKDITQSFQLVAVDIDGNEVNGVVLSEKMGKLKVSVGSEKEVRINPVYKGSLPDNIKLKAVKLSLETVKITGDSSIIKSISKIDTEPINLANITESGTINVKLSIPNGLSLVNDIEEIRASIEVDKTGDNIDNTITKKIDGIKVNLTDKENTALSYEVDNITVEVSGKQSEVNELTAENIVASATVGGLTAAGEYDVNVDISLTQSGQSITIVSKPDKVKITVR